MTLQNRVTPFGEIVADPARGTFMGNRGVLHDDRRRLGKARWKLKAWLVCRLEFRGRHRDVMAPRRYTDLFFLDEATALAAGHRPCFECRRRDFHAYLAAWAAGSGRDPALARPPVGEIDDRLHGERVGPGIHGKRPHDLPWADLPDGAFVAMDGAAWLVAGETLLRWTAAGYDQPRARPAAGTARALTPPTSLAALRGGYRPALHRTAKAG